MLLKYKKSTYVLFPLVLIVWGLLFWKIFVNIGGGGEVDQVTLSDTLPVSESREIDSIPPPSCNYEDPFLKPLKRKQTDNVEEKKEEAPKESVNRVVRWPLVEFLGVVKSKRKNGALGILKIGNKEYLVRKNDVKAEIKVVSISPDSVGLKYQMDTRFFKRRGL